MATFHIVNSHARSIENRPYHVSKGKSHLRLSFSTDLRLYIYAKSATGRFGWLKKFVWVHITRKYIAHTVDGQKVLVNINSLSKRLGVSKSAIRTHGVEGALQLHLDKEAKITTTFNRMMREQFASDPNNNANKYHLNDVIRYAEYSDFQDCKETQKGYIFKKHFVLLLTKEDENTNYSLIDKNSLLGSGSFGHVYKAIDLSKNEELAAKIAKSFKKAIRDVNQEYDMLHHVNQGDPSEGIQRAPVRRISYKLNGKSYEGFLGTKYQSNLTSPYSADEKVEFARQILEGVVALKAKRIVHADIKPDNCFITKDRKKCHLADFGLATRQDTKLRYPFYGTPFFYPLTDMKIALGKWYNPFLKLDEDMVFKRDIYSAGVVIKFLNLGENQDLKTLIGRMTDENYKMRMPPEVALERFNALFPKKSSLTL